MAVEQNLLASLTDAERSELERRAEQIRELKKKVGTQRALQIVGSGLAIAGNKPALLSKMTPKFGYTPSEKASRKAALRKERHALMGEQEAAVQFGQTLLKDLQKNQLGHKGSIVAEIQRMYTGAIAQLNQSARTRAEIESKAADAAYKQAGQYSVMESRGDESNMARVDQAIQDLNSKMEGSEYVDERTGGISGEAAKQIQKVLASNALRVPGAKEFFVQEIHQGAFPKLTFEGFLNTLRMRLDDPNLEGSHEAGVIVQAVEDDRARKEKYKASRDALLLESAEKYEEAGRKAFGGTWNEKLFNNIEAAMKGIDGAANDEEATGIMRKLAQDLSKGPVDDERANEIKNLRMMEEAYDKDLGPAPVRKAYRLMEQSPAVQKIKAELTAPPPQGKGYNLTDKQVVKLILKNSRHEMMRTDKASKPDFSLLSKMIRSGLNIVAKKDVPPRDEATVTAAIDAKKKVETPTDQDSFIRDLVYGVGGEQEEEAAGVDEDQELLDRLYGLTSKAANLVPQKDEEGPPKKTFEDTLDFASERAKTPSSTIINMNDPLNQTQTAAEVYEKVTEEEAVDTNYPLGYPHRNWELP